MNNNDNGNGELNTCSCDEPVVATIGDEDTARVDVCSECHGIVEPTGGGDGKWCECMGHEREVTISQGQNTPYGHYQCGNCGKPIQ